MSLTLASRRSKLLASLRALPEPMKQRLSDLKKHATQLRQRSDLLWFELVQAAATLGNSRGWENLRDDAETLASISYSTLRPLTHEEREARVLAAFRKAKVRMQTLKAPQLAANFLRIEELGGVEQATQTMLSLRTRLEKFAFIKSFEGVGEKYARDIWMDVYDHSFRDAVAIDARVKSVSDAIGFVGTGYESYESFFVSIANDANLEPWELDRLLYNFRDHFLKAIES
jgi:hypothetical protein